MENAQQKEYTLKQLIVLRLLVLHTLRTKPNSRIASFDTVYIRAYTAPQEMVIFIISTLRASNFVKDRTSLDSFTITAYLHV